MRVVSLVPSWTETLIEAGVEVVGRTRFCIHPSARIKDIPAVGGTKNWDLPAIEALKPDLLILDQEENPKWMGETDIPSFVSHVTSIDSLTNQLAKMSIKLRNPNLVKFATRWEKIAKWQGLPRWTKADALPGLLEWGRIPEKPIENVIYVIWRNPWMTVSKDTFIGSVLTKVGFGEYLRASAEKYPKFELGDFDTSETLILFSSEPYAFLRKKEEVKPNSAPYAFVDGERFSWFGVRSLRFLEHLKASLEAPEP